MALAGTATQNDAYSLIQATLKRYDLGTLAKWAWDQIIAGRSPAEIEIALYERKEFQTRFKVIFDRQKAGLPAMSPADVLAWEAGASQLMRMANLPPGFYDSYTDFQNLMANDVSLVELQQRVEFFVAAAYEAPFEVRQQLKDLYGIDEAGIAAYYMDEDRALPILQRQFQAAQQGAAAQRQGFGALTVDEAERLGGLISPDQAEQAFGALVEGRQLLTGLPGQNETDIDRETQIAFASGNVEAIQKLQRRSREREATFEAGGQYAASAGGVTGLGSATRT